MSVEVRPYEPSDETGWLRCRVLSFLNTAYHDNVMTHKETYDHSSIELVAASDGAIVGLLDIEYEQNEGAVTFQTEEDPRSEPGAVMHHVAVHPDYHRRGIGEQMLEKALGGLTDKGVGFVEAWTRDDDGTCRWYEAQRFRCTYSYLHVYIDGSEETEGTLVSEIPGLVPRYTFAHFTGEDRGAVRQQFDRVHECRLYRRTL